MKQVKLDCLIPWRVGESWWGVEGRRGKVFYLCFFVSTFPRFLCSWEFSFLLYWCPKQKRMHCFWASGLLVQQQAYLYDTCNLNIQTNYQKENVCCAFFFFLHWILAVCNVYWIFKTVYLTFFYNTGDSHMVLKKRNFTSSTLFSLSPSRTHVSLSPSFQQPVAGAAGHAAVHASVTCLACKSKVKCFTLIWKEKSSPQIVCIYVLKQHHVNTYMQCLWSK